MAERPLRVTLCPVNTAGVPWTNAEALRRRGVDARLVVFERYRLHPEADWSLDAPSNSLLLSRQAKQWAAFVYAPEMDVLRAPMKVEALPYSVEELTFAFTDVTGTSATLRLMWDTVMASVPFTVAR